MWTTNSPHRPFWFLPESKRYKASLIGAANGHTHCLGYRHRQRVWLITLKTAALILPTTACGSQRQGRKVAELLVSFPLMRKRSFIICYPASILHTSLSDSAQGNCLLPTFFPVPIATPFIQRKRRAAQQDSPSLALYGTWYNLHLLAI